MVALNSNGFIDIKIEFKEYKKKLKSLGLECWGDVKKGVERYYVYNDGDFKYWNLTRDQFLNTVEETYRKYERSLRKHKLNPEIFICKKNNYCRSQYRNFHRGEMFYGRIVDNDEPRHKYYYDSDGVCQKCYPIEKKLMRIYHRCINDPSSRKYDNNNHHKDFFIDEFNKIFYTKNEVRLLKLKEISGEPNVCQIIHQERIDFLNSLKKCISLRPDEYRPGLHYYKIKDTGEYEVYNKEEYDEYLNDFYNRGGSTYDKKHFKKYFKDIDLKEQRKKKLNKINGLLDLQECS
jgi:hypothetical protein